MNSLKILVIDDEEGIRWVIEQILKQKNHQVTTASHGKEGIEIFEKKPDFDLVISDRSMPEGGIRGEEVLRIIKSLNPRTKTILMSAFDNEQEAIQATEVAGANSFFNKSVHLDLSEINDSINNLFPALLR